MQTILLKITVRTKQQRAQLRNGLGVFSNFILDWTKHMTNFDRQLTLDTRMYRNKTFGKEAYCNYCWAKTYSGCFAGGLQRSKQFMCVKAECRANKDLFKSPLYEMMAEPNRKRHYKCGLTKEDL